MEKLKLKQAVIVLLTMIGLLSGQVYAAQAQVESLQAQPVATFSQSDINAMFDQTDQPMQLAVLSQQEMMETEGALVWKPVIAGAWLGTKWVARQPAVRHGAAGAVSAVGGFRAGGGTGFRATVSVGAAGFVSGATGRIVGGPTNLRAAIGSSVAAPATGGFVAGRFQSIGW